MDKYEQAYRLAKLTWICGPIDVSKKRATNQERERQAVIRLWNEGSSVQDIAKIIKKSVSYVTYYMHRFKYFYGDAVERRCIPVEMPEV